MNFGTPVPLLIGIVLILGALALFFLERFKPGYERDSDKVYAVLLMISGLFLLTQLNMELLASFQQLLMGGMLTTLLIETVRNRLPRTEPTIDPRSTRPPVYDRPPAGRRVYRAELDDRGAPLRESGVDRSGQRQFSPRAVSGRDNYYPNDFSEQRRVRQPYEEYSGPAARLQASPEWRPEQPPMRENYPEERYGQRPPARPPAGPSPSPYPPQGGFDNGSMNRPESKPNARPEGRPDRGPSDRGQNGGQNDRGSNGYAERPPENYSRPNESFANSGEPADRPNRENRERPANGERTLNVKPYSEAPKLDAPEAPYS